MASAIAYPIALASVSGLLRRDGLAFARQALDAEEYMDIDDDDDLESVSLSE